MLLTKLHLPITGKNIVHRKNLFEKLTDGLDRKLTLVSAPAGYGKTSLICDWVRQNNIASAWCSIDTRDNDPIEFLKILITAIHNKHNDIGINSLELIKSPGIASIDYIIELFINDLLGLKNEIVLVLDDLHLITNKQVVDILSAIIDYKPQFLKLIISTRSDPILALARLRSQNEIMEIRSSDLSFSVNEISNFLNKKLSLGLNEKDLNLLEQKTEGWIAGLQLIALSLQGRENISDYIIKLAGDNRYIMDYLIEEVLNIQTEEVKEFLLKTSILEMFSGSLCNAVLNKENSQLILESLESDNMFIVPLDDEREWFRYHHLFADLLKMRLRLNFEGSLQETHARASEWFEKNEMIINAIEHALESPDYDRAMNLLNGIVEELWDNGQYSTIFNLGNALPERIVQLNKRFCVHYSWTLVLFGKFIEAEKYLNYLESSILEDKDNLDTSNENLLGKVYHTYTILYVFSKNINAAFKYSEKALENLTDLDLIWNTWAVIGHGELCLCRFELQKSNKSFVYAINICNQANNIYLTLVSYTNLANIRKLEGKYNDSLIMCKELLEKTNNSYKGNIKSIEILTSMLHSIIGFVLTEFNNIDEGLKYAVKGYELSKKAESVSWFGYSALLLVETYCKLGDIKKAFQIVHEIEKNKLLPQKMSATAFFLKIKLLVLNNEPEKALDLLNDPINRKDIINEYETYYLNISIARLYISLFRIEEALTLLDDLILVAKKNGANEMLIEVEILRAKAFTKQNEKNNAILSLSNAILYAQSEGFIRTFIFEGKEIHELLKEVKKEKSSKSSEVLDSISHEYLNKLLEAFKKEERLQKFNTEEILSSRELDTLKLIAENHSNQEIADILFISINTVKTHVRNILLNLEAKNRREAVIKAKEKGILLH